MDWITIASLSTAAVSAGAATVGLVYNGRQLRLAHEDRQEERRLGIEGVCVSWHPTIRPNETDVDAGGQAEWVYVFRVDNPGRFPISRVRVTVHFELDVERVEHGGLPTGATRQMKLYHPVLPGGGHREWKRRLRVGFDHRDALLRTTACIEFRDTDGRDCKTHWPAGTAAAEE